MLFFHTSSQIRGERMTFWEAYKSFWKNYFNFNGYSTRKEYWFVFIWNVTIIITVTLGIFFSGFSFFFYAFSSGNASNTLGTLTLLLILCLAIYILATFIPNLSIIVRRFHDVGLSGWWYIGPYIFTSVCSIIINSINISEGLELIFALLSLLFSIGTIVVLALPTGKLTKNS